MPPAVPPPPGSPLSHPHRMASGVGRPLAARLGRGRPAAATPEPTTWLIVRLGHGSLPAVWHLSVEPVLFLTIRWGRGIFAISSRNSVILANNSCFVAGWLPSTLKAMDFILEFYIINHVLLHLNIIFVYFKPLQSC